MPKTKIKKDADMLFGDVNDIPKLDEPLRKFIVEFDKSNNRKKIAPISPRDEAELIQSIKDALSFAYMKGFSAQLKDINKAAGRAFIKAGEKFLPHLKRWSAAQPNAKIMLALLEENMNLAKNLISPAERGRPEMVKMQIFIVLLADAYERAFNRPAASDTRKETPFYRFCNGVLRTVFKSNSISKNTLSLYLNLREEWRDNSATSK